MKRLVFLLVVLGTGVALLKADNPSVITFPTGGSPGGSTTQLQYNNSGAFGGIAGSSWDGSTLILPGIASSTPTFNAASANIIPHLDANKQIAGATTDIFWDDTNKRMGMGKNSGLSYDIEIQRNRNGEPVGIYTQNTHAGGDAVFCNANDTSGVVCMGVGGTSFAAPYANNQFFTSTGNVYFLPVANSTVAVVSADFATTTVGKTLKIAKGTNGKFGTFTLSSGAVFVANTSITANSVIMPTIKTISGTMTTITISSTTVGGGFNAAGAATDNSTYNYAILEAF